MNKPPTEKAIELINLFNEHILEVTDYQEEMFFAKTRALLCVGEFLQDCKYDDCNGSLRRIYWLEVQQQIEKRK